MHNVTEIIGFIAAVFTTIAFFPQAIKVIKEKQTKDLSLVMYIIFCCGVFLWLVYGLMLHVFPLIIANFVTLILGLIILFYKVKFG